MPLRSRGKHRRRQHLISILVPLGGDDPARLRNWEWLRAYLECHLPDAEIVIGRDRASERRWCRKPKPFSKAAAVNDAFRRSRGDVIVILDADAFLAASVIEHCAERLRHQRRCGDRSWFVPYRHLYRLRRPTTERVLESDPCHPLWIPSPPPAWDIDGKDGSGPINIYGAMCQIMPREAFETVGGMDTRFRGWGAEDLAFACALDTLWGQHDYTHNDILHLWHPSVISGQGASWTIKMWPRQTRPGVNNELGGLYLRVNGDAAAMRALVNEGRK